MKCPRCQQENEPVSSFCIFCGSPLRTSESGISPEPRQTEGKLNDIREDIAHGQVVKSRKEKNNIQQTEKKDNEVQEDLAHGQIVIITFRWIIIIGALIVTLWTLATPEAVIGRQAFITFLLLVYAAVNFLLLTRYLRRSPSLIRLTYVMSLVDLILITVVIALQEDIVKSHVYFYYYPALMVLAVTFPTRIAAGYAIGAIVVYGIMIAGSGDAAQILSRLLVMAAVAFCACLYRRIEHNRRAGKAKLVSLGGGDPDGSL